MSQMQSGMQNGWNSCRSYRTTAGAADRRRRCARTFQFNVFAGRGRVGRTAGGENTVDGEKGGVCRCQRCVRWGCGRIVVVVVIVVGKAELLLVLLAGRQLLDAKTGWHLMMVQIGCIAKMVLQALSEVSAVLAVEKHCGQIC